MAVGQTVGRVTGCARGPAAVDGVRDIRAHLPSQANASVTPVKNTATTQMPTHADLRCLTPLTARLRLRSRDEATRETVGANLPAEVDGVVPLRDFGLGGPTSLRRERLLVATHQGGCGQIAWPKLSTSSRR